MSKFTPGPWSTDGHLYGGSRIFTGIDKLPIVSVLCRNDEGEANARLIAAAPEMYAALEQIERMGYADFGDRLMVEAAVKKARGE